ncbi:hypothetical protein M011DRAFT_495838 [Sporormia fimetaria CBS 119925]|uniref:Alpha/beta hydrolase fold-3 domain-containing protein n=1 Tax=Sporormia fimetaria CBS 119925 TaxID=1340428 RepID=A0A6A6V3E3_9PLEO|nr:hypothetical protein M011DRAFT_495838 [Sporormia fimetaria CBS 119925]
MKEDRPRWMLHVQAQFWRYLMSIGMFLHRLARPLPPSPAFSREVKATISPLKGKFNLYFYTPKDYKANKKLRGKRYPCVINFHGGGFVLGTPHDDARWIGAVVDQVDAVVVSVDYRLAPEFPFPTAVEDGADAILWLAKHANDLQLDTERFAVSGFSSGGNMSFTVPLCLQGEFLDRLPSGQKIAGSHEGSVPEQPPVAVVNTKNSRIPLSRQVSRLDRIAMLRETGSSSLSLVTSVREGAAVNVTSQGITVKIRGIVSFYPPTDYTVTREQRRQTCVRADQNLPAVFTQLFDDSYLQPPTLDLSHPWLSPGKAPADMLQMLPNDIAIICCEWDMLLAEGERFRDRLKTELGKNVRYHCVPGVPHGWDKAPNPLRESPGAREQYGIACKELKRMFGMEEEEDAKEVV